MITRRTTESMDREPGSKRWGSRCGNGLLAPVTRPAAARFFRLRRRQQSSFSGSAWPFSISCGKRRPGDLTWRPLFADHVDANVVAVAEAFRRYAAMDGDLVACPVHFIPGAIAAPMAFSRRKSAVTRRAISLRVDNPDEKGDIPGSTHSSGHETLSTRTSWAPPENGLRPVASTASSPSSRWPSPICGTC
jgi:hypothetical protein